MCSSWLSLPLCLANREKSIIKNQKHPLRNSTLRHHCWGGFCHLPAQAPPHLQMMPMDVLVNVVMPEGTEWHFDDFNMLMCTYIHSKASLFKQQRTLNLTQLHIICSKHSIGSQMIPTATTNVIQIVSKHWIGQILVLTFQPHQPLHINLVFCNICRDATKCLRRNPFSSKSIFCLEPPCSNCDVHYFGWSKLISTTTNLQKPSPSPYSVFFLILLHGC